MLAMLSLSEVVEGPSFHVPFLFFTFLQPLVYYSCIHYFPTVFHTSRQRSWILTAFSSLIMTFGSLPFLFRFVTGDSHLGYFDWLDTDAAIGLAAFFITYLLSDLVIGTIEYRSQIHPVSGWFHHILYTFIVFYLIQWRLCGAFCIFAFLELPTLLLAIGTIKKELRTDKLFGFVFFSTRIVFHAYMIEKIYQGFQGYYFYLIPCGIFPMHVLWFGQWVKQQVLMGSKMKVNEGSDRTSTMNDYFIIEKDVKNIENCLPPNEIAKEKEC